MIKYLNAEELERDGWTLKRKYEVSPYKINIEIVNPTDMKGQIFPKNIVNWQWVNQEYEKPVIQEEVILSVCDNSGDTKFYYTTSGWYAGNDLWIANNDVVYGVTHWAKMPEPFEI